MELKLVCVLLLAFTLSAEAGATTESSSATPSTEGSSPATSTTEGSSATPSIEGSSPATSTTEGSSAPPSAEGSSPATSTTEDTSATPSTTEDTSATPSTTEDTSTTPSTTEDTSTTPSTTEDTSATTSTIVGSSATPIKTGASKSTGTTSRVTKAQSTAARKETAQFKIELIVKVNASFDDLLQNASSELCKNHARDLKEKVKQVYEKIPGILGVAVTGFSCNSSDDVVCFGDKCEVQGSQMSMSAGSIAGIAGGVGGGAILLLSIALGCMCCSRRKGKNPEKDMANEDEVALSERYERDIYSHRQPGQFNYGADIKDEYRYTGRKDEGRGYEEWLMHKERSEHESSGRRGENDFRAPNYSGNWGRSHGDDRRGDNANMEPDPMFGGVRTSGLGTSQYSSPEDVPPDYDQDDKRQIIPHPRDQSRENPYTRMPGDQPPSRPQSSLLSNSYSQGGNVYEHIDTDEPYALRRPNYR